MPDSGRQPTCNHADVQSDYCVTCLRAERAAIFAAFGQEFAANIIGRTKAKNARILELQAERDALREQLGNVNSIAGAADGDLVMTEDEIKCLREQANKRLCQSCLESHPVDVMCPPYLADRTIDPTHWMPLPASPAKETP